MSTISDPMQPWSVGKYARRSATLHISSDDSHLIEKVVSAKGVSTNMGKINYNKLTHMSATKFTGNKSAADGRC
jgi:hypothetical protein